MTKNECTTSQDLIVTDTRLVTNKYATAALHPPDYCACVSCWLGPSVEPALLSAGAQSPSPAPCFAFSDSAGQ